MEYEVNKTETKYETKTQKNKICHTMIGCINKYWHVWEYASAIACHLLISLGIG